MFIYNAHSISPCTTNYSVGSASFGSRVFAPYGFVRLVDCIISTNNSRFPKDLGQCQLKDWGNIIITTTIITSRWFHPKVPLEKSIYLRASWRTPGPERSS
ncbi:hypothetical protein Ocin01_03194 [Orchesella cincta]|uniref:Uncharacterized protein n=1 Tax=Orchesella cincta TaxID=48709 RepID=A0A1D2NEX1_ORCCI|nr:hypothetical protein Ocin01_03194 [Orchesella cincta]